MTLPSLPSMRIVYFTSLASPVTNSILEMLEQLGQQVLLVVVTPGPKTRRTEAYKDVVANRRPGADILVTNHIDRLASMLRGLEPDLIFVTGFPWRLPAELISLPRLGSVNTHPALLPRYRGPDPFFWQFMNGETETGLTIHRMEPEFDTGPILAQGRIPIGPDDDFQTVFERITPLAPELIIKALAAVAAGEPGTPQSEEGASYARLRTEADRLLDWSRSAVQLHNQVRAWGPAGALAEVNGQSWVVRRARVAAASTGDSAAITPGTLVGETPEGMLVQTGDGKLMLQEMELPAA